MESALENQKKNAQLASAFAKDHPNSAIRSVEDFYKFIQNNPNVAETWIKTKEDIPIERRGVQELASSFQALDQLEYLENLPEPEQQKPDKNIFKDALTLAASPFALRNNDVKLAEDALAQTSPDINLHEFTPTELLSNTDFQSELAKIQKAVIADEQAKNPNKILKEGEKDALLSKRHDDIHARALEVYAGTSSERAEQINRARENDAYLKGPDGRIAYVKDANGNTKVQERIFTDEKNKPNPLKDPVFVTYQKQKRKAINDALEKSRREKKNGIKQKYSEEDLTKLITFQYDTHFATMFPGKAEAYSKQDEGLKYSIKTVQKAEKRIERREQKQLKKDVKQESKISPPPPQKPTAKPVQINTPAPTKHKSAKVRQKEWNSQKIATAMLHGYNPKAVLNNLVSWSSWKKNKSMQGKKPAPPPPPPSKKTGIYSSPQPIDVPFRWRGSPSRSISKITSRFSGGSNSQSSNPVANLGKSAAKKLGNELASKAIAQVRDKAVMALLENPVSLLIIGIVLLVILAIIMVLIVVVTAMNGGGDSTGAGGLGPSGPGGTTPPNSNPIPGFTINKTVDKTQVTFDPANPENITYTISYSYTPASGASIQLSDIKIVDKISDNADFVSASGNASFDKSVNTVTWNLSDSGNSSPLTLVVKPVSDNIIINNKATAMATSSVNKTTPNSDTCNGFYTLTSPSGNFGDPNCDFADDGTRAQAMNKIGEILKAQDPNNADAWFQIIIPAESSWVPNAYAPSSTSGNGAYGLYQMNPEGKSTSGPYDIGNVGWAEQTSNAMGLAATLRNNSIPYAPPKGYWQAWTGVTQK